MSGTLGVLNLALVQRLCHAFGFFERQYAAASQWSQTGDTALSEDAISAGHDKPDLRVLVRLGYEGAAHFLKPPIATPMKPLIVAQSVRS